jgi:membrane protease YdiL (CAAX protease family)
VDVAILTLLLNVLLSVALGTLLRNMSGVMGIQLLGTPIGTAILGASEIFLLIPLLLYSKRLGIARSQFFPHEQDWQQRLSDIFAGALMGLAMVPASILLSIVNDMILGPEPGAEAIKSAFAATSPLEAILLVSAIIFAVAPSEEIISRGFVQQGLEWSFGRLKGLLLASVIFSIIHLNFWSFIPLTGLGMLLGLVFMLRHNRVLAPITSHAVYMVCLIVIDSI